ncbi:hypothetical protein [Microvirga flavescens]|uniref:hypothetical protein n=1 Tax=Microvirga flavescens TaxID=2249811 RepID=UPI000DD79AA5|nr:hypothetical protein [Microvirga flavescens]
MRVPVVASIAALLVTGLAACNSSQSRPPVVSAPVAQAPAFVADTPDYGPVLGPDGRCTGNAPATAAAIEPGIGECDLVRLKGKPATDVLVGESGKGQREVQVLYFEPGGRELYFFVNNKLDRIVKP